MLYTTGIREQETKPKKINNVKYFVLIDLTLMKVSFKKKNLCRYSVRCTENIIIGFEIKINASTRSKNVRVHTYFEKVIRF